MKAFLASLFFLFSIYSHALLPNENVKLNCQLLNGSEVITTFTGYRYTNIDTVRLYGYLRPTQDKTVKLEALGAIVISDQNLDRSVESAHLALTVYEKVDKKKKVKWGSLFATQLPETHSSWEATYEGNISWIDSKLKSLSVRCEEKLQVASSK